MFSLHLKLRQLVISKNYEILHYGLIMNTFHFPTFVTFLRTHMITVCQGHNTV